MSIEIKSPTFPESVADGTIANWLKKEGETVNQDEVIVEIETDKVVLEVLAQSDGVITKIIKSEGDTVSSSEVIGEFKESEGAAEPVKEKVIDKPATKKTKNKKDEIVKDKTKNSGPAAKKIISEKGIDASNIKSSGKGNRITKADVVNHLESKESTGVLSENTTCLLYTSPSPRD